MKRLCADEIELINSLVSDNKSLNQIANKLSLNKTTIYYWYRKIKPKVLKKFEVKDWSDEKLGEFMGIFAGDGNYTVDNNYNHQIRIYLTGSDTNYITYVGELMESIFNRKPSVYRREQDNVASLRLISCDLSNFIKAYLEWDKKKTESICLKENAKSHSKDFLIGFVRGLSDTDGHIGKNFAVFTTISQKLANDIEDSLELLDITHKRYLHIDKRGNRKPVTRIFIRKDFQKFITVIKPKHFSLNIANDN